MATTAPSRTETLSNRNSVWSQILTMTGVAVRDRAPLVGVVALIMVGLGVLTGGLWHPLQDAFDAISPEVLDAIGGVLAGADLTTAAGWMNAEMLSLVAPGGLIAVAILSASKGIAGEEQAKTIGVLLSVPVSRTAFLAAKTVAMILNVLLATLGVAAGILLGDTVGDLGIDPAGVLGACAHVALLALLLGTLTVLLAALTGDGKLSSAISAGIAVLAFGLNAFLPLSDSLSDYTQISPWYYFAESNPLVNGPDYTHLLVLATTTLLLLIVAIIGYRRRDLRS